MVIVATTRARGAYFPQDQLFQILLYAELLFDRRVRPSLLPRVNIAIVC
jgi:hypothetical protein